MKFKKLFSFVAAVATAGVMAVSASADWAVVEGGAEGLSSSTDNWMIPIYCNGEATDIVATDYKVDLSTVKSVAFTFTVQQADIEFFNGDFGGGIISSFHTSNIAQIPAADVKDEDKTMTDPDGKAVTPYEYYNWYQAQYWGVSDPNAPDPDADDGSTINHLATDKPVQIEALGNYTYRAKGDIANPVIDGAAKAEEVKDFRVALKTWNGSLFKADVTRCVIFDKDGKALLAFDGKGNKVDVTADDEKTPDNTASAPAESGASSAANSAAASTAESAASTADSAAASNASNAASTATSETTSTAASTAASTPAESTGLPTGAIVGIIAGVVVVVVIIIIAVVVSKKKK